MRAGCGRYKHCPALTVMLYAVAGVTTGQLTSEYGIPQGSIDKLRLKGRIGKHHGKGFLCDALVSMLYQFTDDTTQEIANAYGVTKKVVLRCLENQGVKRVRKFRSKAGSVKVPEAVRVTEICGQTVALECLRCGCEFTRWIDSRQSYACPECRVRQERKRKEQRKEAARAERRSRRADELARPKACAECGGIFHSEHKTARYCSDECRRKARNHRVHEKRKHRGLYGNHVKRAKRTGAKFERGITLSELIARDGGICQICGEPIDSADTSWGYSGPRYPSIDHIVAIAKGGAHTWDNVQLAHCICNSVKGAN